MRYKLSPEQLAAVPWQVTLPAVIEPFRVQERHRGIEITEQWGRTVAFLMGGALLFVVGIGLAIWEFGRTRDLRGPGTFGAAFGGFLLYKGLNRHTVTLRPTEGEVEVLGFLVAKIMARNSFDSIGVSITCSKMPSVESSLSLFKENKLIINIAQSAVTQTESRTKQLISFAVWFASVYGVDLIVELRGQKTPSAIQDSSVGDLIQPLINAAPTQPS